MSLLNLDDMLSANLASVEAAPEFITLDTGVYDFVVKKVDAKKREAKDKAKAVAEGKATEWFDLVLTYGVENTVSLEKSDSLPPKPGSLVQEQFQFTEKGLPYFKSRVVAVAIAMGGTEEDANSLSPKDVMDTFPEAARFRANVRKVVETTDGKEFVKNRISNVVAIPA